MVAAANGVVTLELPDEWRDIATARVDVRALCDLPGAAERFLAPEEHADWTHLSHAARRSEWLAARVCLKSLLLDRAAIDDPREASVSKNERGRPSLRTIPGDCSLAHSGNIAGAAWTSRPDVRIGLDIERISPRLKRASGAYRNFNDASVMPRDELHQLAVWWTLKEAASKAWGLGLGAGLAEIACHETVSHFHRMRHADGKSCLGWHCEFDEFVLTLCVSGGAA
jgi:phosphopantetheinyl transferase